MNKKTIGIICLVLLVFLTAFQVLFSCQLAGYGSKSAFLEQALAEEEIKNDKYTFLMSSKTELTNLEAYAGKNGFVKNMQTLVLSSGSSFAYNW